MRNILGVFVGLVMFGVLPTLAVGATIELKLRVPTVCVAKPVSASVQNLQVKTFCNAPRGGRVFVVGSASGGAVTLNVGGRRIVVQAGQQREVFASAGPFKDTLRIAVSGGRSDGVGLLFHAVPNS